MGILKLEKKKLFTAIRLLFFKECRYWKSINISQDFFWQKKKKSYKYFVGYLYNDNKVKSLQIMFHKTRGYIKSYNGQTKSIYFLIEDDDLLKKYNTTWDRFTVYKKKRVS